MNVCMTLNTHALVFFLLPSLSFESITGGIKRLRRYISNVGKKLRFSCAITPLSSSRVAKVLLLTSLRTLKEWNLINLIHV